jgi:UTP-glucose-1-phosphate uridylyltransferase
MKVVILAGGYGTRISEESGVRPKPMVEIGGKPILWHIMKIYSAHGLNDFIICCGYKSHVIKDFFANYYLRSADVTFDLAKNAMKIHRGRDILSHIRRWIERCQYWGVDSLSQVTRNHRHPDRGSATRQIWGIQSEPGQCKDIDI